MKETLKLFLQADDLDALSNAREKLSTIDAEDQACIMHILQTGENSQEVANLLMYPELILQQKRIDYLMAGLNEGSESYLTLASVVGCDRLRLSDVPAERREELIVRTLSIVENSVGILADRASVLIADKLWRLDEMDAARIVGFLDHSSEVVQHNVLVALIPLVGLETLCEVLEGFVQAGIVSRIGQSITEEKLSQIDGFSKVRTIISTVNSQQDSQHFDLGFLETSLLVYVPNYEEWCT